MTAETDALRLVRADDAVRVRVPEMERSAENQRPKTRDWRDLRLVRFDGTDLCQWRGKQKDSIFEDQASEVFVLAAAPAVQPAQGSESGGEIADLIRAIDALAVQAEPSLINGKASVKVMTQTLTDGWKAQVPRFTGHTRHAEDAAFIVKLCASWPQIKAALAQPGPASEGEAR